MKELFLYLEDAEKEEHLAMKLIDWLGEGKAYNVMLELEAILKGHTNEHSD